MQIAALKIENNEAAGQHWIEFWCVYVKTIDGVRRQFMDPETGEKAKYIKLENAMHPLAPGTGLGQCDTCGTWHQRAGGPCGAGDPACPGMVQYYDGLTRALSCLTADGATIYEAVRDCCYAFLTSEEVPDPFTWETVTLLDGTQE